MSEESREFQIFIKPVGARCNLKCSYCYYLGKRDVAASLPEDLKSRKTGDVSAASPCGLLSGEIRDSNPSLPAGLMSDEKRDPAAPSTEGLMSDEILENYIRQHIEASTEHEIFFSWHGGEPTLAGINFYRKAVTVQKLYKPADSIIQNGIQTNATLINDEWGRFLISEGFYVGISIDGPEEYHNINRTRSGHKGTFANVMRGIDIIRKYNIPHEFLCVVSNDNVHAPLEIYSFFRDQGASYITFLPLVEKMAGHSGKVTSNSVRAEDFGRFLSVIFDEWIKNDIGRLKVQIFEEALRTAFHQEHTLCIFKRFCGGVPVVEMNGDFYQCDHYVNAEHRLGNIMESSLALLLDHPQQRLFGEAKWHALPQYCLDCEVLDMCNGECPKNRFMITPSGEPGLNYLCEGYRHFFNHCLPFVNEVARLWQGED